MDLLVVLVLAQASGQMGWVLLEAVLVGRDCDFLVVPVGGL